MTDLWTAALALTDSILVRTLALTVVLIGVLFVIGLCRAAGRPMPQSKPQPLTWTPEALGRVLKALDEFDVDDALDLANDRTFDRTLDEIRALKETS